MTDVSEPPFMLPPDRTIIDHWCRMCGLHFQSIHRRHLYCAECSESQDLRRKRLDGIRSTQTRSRDLRRDTGLEISKEEKRSLVDPMYIPELAWQVRVRVPFSWSGSKNAIYVLRRKGHVALRKEASDYRKALILSLQAALQKHHIVQNKLWIDIFVEKNNHKGDAVNFVDTICDAVKVATNLDDRWYCIRNLNWSIVKHDPMLMVGIGQEEIEPVQPCSYCGRLQSFSCFSANRSLKSGRARICNDCRKGSLR